MQVIPAIDVSRGRLARLDSGRRVEIQAFEGDPLAAARAFLEAGADIVHLVDMDRAFEGTATCLELITEATALGARVQASGGIVEAREVAEALDAGAFRVVLGSASLRDCDELGHLLGQFGERVVVGLETDGESISPRGRWGQGPSEPISLKAAVESAISGGAARFLLTQVAKVGGMAGFDIVGVESLMSLAAAVPVVVSGGVATVDELPGLQARGVEGVVVGRALYEDGFDLAEAIGALA